MKNLSSVKIFPRDKYYYYRESVQSPENDVIFLRDTYKDIRKKEPKSLCEDFCGTHAISCEWVLLNEKYDSFGIDLDLEPVEYGTKYYLSQMSASDQKRVTIKIANVLDKNLPTTDIILAINFSYYIFKQRKELISYFKNCQERLNKDGLFIVDCFGGPQCMIENEEETEHEDFSYFWDQDNYDPITNYASYYIHFKPKGEKKMAKAFSYDWRMWSIPEIREAMESAGFSKTHVYWEGTNKDGEGDGVFSKVEVGEECEAWVAYIVAEK